MSNLERLTKRLEGLKEGHTAYLGSIGNTQRSPGALLSLKMEAKRYKEEREDYAEGSNMRKLYDALLSQIKGEIEKNKQDQAPALGGGRRNTRKASRKTRKTRKSKKSSK